MNDTARVALTFFGSIIFCAAVVGTVQSLLQGGQGGGPLIGSIVIGVGLGFLLIPWLPDDRRLSHQATDHEQPRQINAA